MTVTLDLRALLIAACVLLMGADRQRLVDPIEWQEVAPYVADDLREIAPERVKVLAGDPAPFDGWLLAGGAFPRVVAAYDDAVGAYQTCARGRAEDRWFADRVHGATIEGLRTCRKSHPRTFAAGAAVGFGGCAATGWFIEGVRP